MRSLMVEEEVGSTSKKKAPIPVPLADHASAHCSPTSPLPPRAYTGTLAHDLEQAESRAEVYPCTVAFTDTIRAVCAPAEPGLLSRLLGGMRLLRHRPALLHHRIGVHSPSSQLLASPLRPQLLGAAYPATLGLPYREPGPYPYVAFLRDRVFLEVIPAGVNIAKDRADCALFDHKC